MAVSEEKRVLALRERENRGVFEIRASRRVGDWQRERGELPLPL